MLSYSKELIMVLDNESRIIDVNDNFLALLNLSRKDTLGKTITYLSPPDVDVHELLETLTTRFEEKEDTITLRIKDRGSIFSNRNLSRLFLRMAGKASPSSSRILPHRCSLSGKSGKEKNGSG